MDMTKNMTFSSSLKAYAEAYKALKRPDIVMLAQPGVSFGDAMPGQRNYMYPISSTPLGSPMAAPAPYRRSAMGSLLASSPRTKPPAHSPHTPATPKASLSCNTRKQAASESSEERSEKRRSNLHHASLTPPRSLSENTSMCEEAYQLVQFCNHCTFGLDSSNRETVEPCDTPNVSCQSMSGLSTPNQGTSLKPKNRLTLQPMANQTLFCHEETDESHYPFITPLTGEQDVALSQLNDANYQCHPGPPKELIITKCKPKSSKGELCRTCREMDEAIRPVVYDWNGWWEAEHVLCVMNEESYANYIECRSEEDIRNILARNFRSARKALKSPAKPLDSSYITPIKNPMPLLTPQSEPARRSQCGVKRVYGQSWIKKLKAPRQGIALDDVRRSRCKSTGQEMSDPFTKSLVADACKSLKLIVSIPFRKLVTERQMKKYCGEGGKHRIPTR